MDGPLTGTLIDGRYRVGSIVGSGGFGTVYAGVHVGLAGKVALKVPRLDDLAPGEAARLVAAFLDEGRLLKRLRHPHIVAALDVGLLPPDASGRGLPYLVLEWCDGSTLKDWLAARRAPPSRETAWALLRPVFDAIAHAHDQGIAHRDLKPANVVLEEQRSGALVARVIDFGIAKLVDPPSDSASGATRTTSDRPAYTPKYASPEQLLGLRSGPPSDVFALALVLLEVVLGRPVHASNEAARAAVAEGTLPRTADLGVDLGPWSEVIDRALSWRAADRFSDARDFARALDAAGTHARRSSTPPTRTSSVAPGAAGPRRPASSRPPAETPSITARTGAGPRGGKNMAHALVTVGGRNIYLALHTRTAPSDAEWRAWTTTLEAQCKANGWDLEATPNLVITDGGAPSTAQRTAVNVLIAQAKTLPSVALVTGSSLVRMMVRGFSIFNPRIRIFAPADVGAAIAHIGVDRSRLQEILALAARLEADELGAGAVETLGVLTHKRG